MKKYTQEEISESQGRQSRYQVMPLDEDGKPSRYYGTDESPVNKYALVDRKNSSYHILEELESENYSDAYEELMGYVIEEKANSMAVELVAKLEQKYSEQVEILQQT